MLRLAVPLAACLPLLAACGEKPDAPPHVFAVKAPQGSVREDFPRAGMTLERPRNWTLRRRDAPEVFELTSGLAVVAAWAYTRQEPLPEPGAQLDAAKTRLVDAIRQRDPGYRVVSSTTTEVAGSPAIEVTGEQVIARERLATRSVHVFKGSVEYVIEAIEPPRARERVETGVLEPLLDSLELEGEVREATG